jgi:flagellar hook-length control protein FliK
MLDILVAASRPTPAPIKNAGPTDTTGHLDAGGDATGAFAGLLQARIAAQNASPENRQSDAGPAAGASITGNEMPDNAVAGSSEAPGSVDALLACVSGLANPAGASGIATPGARSRQAPRLQSLGLDNTVDPAAQDAFTSSAATALNPGAKPAIRSGIAKGAAADTTTELAAAPNTQLVSDPATGLPVGYQMTNVMNPGAEYSKTPEDTLAKAARSPVMLRGSGEAHPVATDTTPADDPAPPAKKASSEPAAGDALASGGAQPAPGVWIPSDAARTAEQAQTLQTPDKLSITASARAKIADPRLSDAADARGTSATDAEPPTRSAKISARPDLTEPSPNAARPGIDAVQTHGAGGTRETNPAPDGAVRVDLIGRTDALSGAEMQSRSAPDAVPVLHSQQVVGTPEWKREFGTQVTLLVSRREPQAEIRLNPDDLGPVQVRIGLQGDQVSVAFSAHQPETRAAIENAIPQLREMLANNGLALGQASVNAESSQQQGNPSGRPHWNGPAGEPVAEPEIALAVHRVPVGLVDTFA